MDWIGRLGGLAWIGLWVLAPRVLAIPKPPLAQELRGARVILETLALRWKEGQQADLAASNLSREIEEYRRRLPQLSAEEAALGWRDLVEQTLELPKERSPSSEGRPGELRYLFPFLPGPKSWGILRENPPRPPREFPKRFEFDGAWRLFFGILEGDLASLKAQKRTWDFQQQSHPELSSGLKFLARLLRELELEPESGPSLQAPKVPDAIPNSDFRRRLSQWIVATAQEDHTKRQAGRAWMLEHGPEEAKYFRSGAWSSPFPLPESDLRVLLEERATDPFFEELKGLLEEAPEVDLFEPLIFLGRSTGRMAEALKLLEATLAEPGLSLAVRISLESLWTRTQISRGKLERVWGKLKSRGDLPKEASPSHWVPDTSFWQRWLRIGHLRGRPEWTQRAIEEIFDLDSRGRGPDPISLARDLQVVDKPALAEDVLLRALARPPSTPSGFGNTLRDTWVELAALYSRQGRHADVRTLLREAPDWDARDLAQAPDPRAELEGRALPLGCLAGRALAEAGEIEDARRVLEWTLFHHRGSDPTYRAYLDLLGPKALPFLKQLARRGLREERPWIWQARIHLDQGQPSLAQASLERALSIDSMDCEQAPGDRRLAYRLLSEARRALGDPNGAAHWEAVVRATRLGDAAESSFQIGLTEEAIELSKQALELFPEGDCIRFRLARMSQGVGALEEARVHFRDLWEKSQLGIHVLQNELPNLFPGFLSLDLAEEAFQRPRSDPTRRASQLLGLGLLRLTQSRLPEAAQALQEAAQLAPESFLAWSQLSRIPVWVPPEVRGRAFSRLYELDPFQMDRLNRSSPVRRVSGIGFQGLWRAWEKTRDQSLEPPEVLLDLPKSRAKLDEARSETWSSKDLGRRGSRQPYRLESPGSLLRAHSALHACLLAFRHFWPKPSDLGLQRGSRRDPGAGP